MSDPVIKSCAECPSRLTPAMSKTFFQKTIGVNVCATFGKPLGVIGMNPNELDVIEKASATNCAAHGMPAPGVPNWALATFNVALPSPDVPQQNQPELVNSCQMCEFFIREDVVLQEKGWSAGLCSIKGNLILGTRQTYEAKKCEVKSLGTPNADYISDMFFLPEYGEDFAKNQIEAGVAAQEKKNKVDPNDYETDREVTKKDHDRGIKAWRRISDKSGTRHVMLPIYRLDYFSADDQSKIPRTGDKEHPEDYIDHYGLTYMVAALWMELDETPAAWGEAGTGKTELFRHLAWLMQMPFLRFSITGSTELDDLAGKMHFENNETIFKMGRLPVAWSSPCVMVVDEPNTGPPEVWQFLRPLTDNSKQLVLDMNEGERIDRHQDCYLGMAMNPAWDMRNVGANQIGDADANRMMHMALDLPPEKVEKRIIKTRCAHDGYDISDKELTMIMRIAKDIRALCEDGTLTMSWAIRPQIKVARALRWFDPITAYKMASADYLEPAQAKLVLQAVKAHVET